MERISSTLSYIIWQILGLVMISKKTLDLRLMFEEILNLWIIGYESKYLYMYQIFEGYCFIPLGEINNSN